MIAGHLARDPDELRYTAGQNSKAVCTAQIAVVERRYKDKKTGEWKEKVAWIKLEFWEKRAETFHRLCKKGDNLFVEGRIGQDDWEDKETGQKRQRLKLIVEQWQFAQKKQDDAGEEEPPRRSGSGSRRSSNRSSGGNRSSDNNLFDELSDDEVPF
jgi:single-strand DNA-binding protein